MMKTTSLSRNANVLCSESNRSAESDASSVAFLKSGCPRLAETVSGCSSSSSSSGGSLGFGGSKSSTGSFGCRDSKTGSIHNDYNDSLVGSFADSFSSLREESCSSFAFEYEPYGEGGNNDSFFESVLESSDDEEDDQRIDDKTISKDAASPPRRFRERQKDAAPTRPPRGDAAAFRSKSDDGGRTGRLQRCPSSAARKLPRRQIGGGRSMSFSTLNLDATTLTLSGGSGAPLSRERSKLCRLSSQSNMGSTHDSGHGAGASSTSLPPPHSKLGNLSCPSPRTGQRRRLLNAEELKMDAPTLDGDSAYAQLQVGDHVLLANKEMATSSHLKRRMPRGSLSRSRSSRVTP